MPWWARIRWGNVAKLAAVLVAVAVVIAWPRPASRSAAPEPQAAIGPPTHEPAQTVARTAPKRHARPARRRRTRRDRHHPPGKRRQAAMPMCPLKPVKQSEPVATDSATRSPAAPPPAPHKRRAAATTAREFGGER